MNENITRAEIALTQACEELRSAYGKSDALAGMILLPLLGAVEDARKTAEELMRATRAGE